MPIAKAVFSESFSKLDSIVASNIEPLLAPSMLKDNTTSFVAGQLVSLNASKEVVPFTWTAEAADLPFAGFVLDDAGEEANDVRVILQGALRLEALGITNVLDNGGGASTFDLPKFLALPNVAAGVYADITFQGKQVMKLSVVSDVLPA